MTRRFVFGVVLLTLSVLFPTPPFSDTTAILAEDLSIPTSTPHSPQAQDVAFTPEVFSTMEFAGTPTDMVLADDKAYISINSGGYVIHDLISPFFTSGITHRFDDFGTAKKIMVFDDYLFLLQYDTLLIINNSDYLNPNLIQTLNFFKLHDIVQYQEYFIILDYQTYYIFQPAPNMTLELQYQYECPFEIYHIDVTGSFAVIAGYSDIHILNLFDIQSPTVVSTLNVATILDVLCHTEYLMVYSGNHMNVYSIFDPFNPVLKGSKTHTPQSEYYYEKFNHPMAIYQDWVVYSGTYMNELSYYALQFTAPSFDLGTTYGKFTYDKPGPVESMVIQGDTLFSIRFPTGSGFYFETLHLNALPTLVVQDSFYTQMVDCAFSPGIDDLGLMPQDHEGLAIYNLSNVYSPYVLYRLPGKCSDAVMYGNYIYYNNEHLLQYARYNEGTPPTPISFLSLAQEINEIKVYGAYLFAVTDYTIYQISLTNPENPLITHTYGMSLAEKLCIFGDIFMVPDYFDCKIFRFNASEELELLSTIDRPARGCMLDGNWLYLGYGTKVDQWNVTDLTAPQYVRSLDLPLGTENPIDFVAQGDMLSIMFSFSDIDILTYNMSDPLHLTEMWRYSQGANSLSLDVHNSLYFLSTAETGVRMIDPGFDKDHDALSDAKELYVFYSNVSNPDTDGDGMLDGWEAQYTLDLHKNDTHLDLDMDGLLNFEEFQYNTNPISNDTDGDIMDDFWEILYGYDPTFTQRLQDDDRDRLHTLEEYLAGTNPLVRDSDSDGMDDGFEVRYFFNPLVDNGEEDPDQDGLLNYREFDYNSNPVCNDTDGDGLIDGWEVKYHFPLQTPNGNEDPDLDGLTNLEEFQYGTDPTTPDADGDGLLDSEEVVLGLNPFSIDSDNDTLPDIWEVQEGTLFLEPDADQDPDNDNYTNREEFILRTDPLRNDTDGDGLSDYMEIEVYDTVPTNRDSDGDSFSDYEEILAGTDPRRKSDHPPEPPEEEEPDPPEDDSDGPPDESDDDSSDDTSTDTDDTEEPNPPSASIPGYSGFVFCMIVLGSIGILVKKR